MAELPNSKIESRAINALEKIIDEHDTMDYSFNRLDKEMSWDGYITIFKENNGDQSKNNFDSRIPVQIKGHFDKNRNYVGNRKIKYSVELNDLKAYLSEKGVIYFQIFINEKSESHIYYATLYPSKNLDIIRKAEKKGNKSSKKISFYSLAPDSNILYDIVKQFDIESQRQGSGRTPLVEDMISIRDVEKITSMSITVAGALSDDKLLSGLANGDICMYGTMKDDKYPRPIECFDGGTFFIHRGINKDISIDDKIYYNKYIVEKSSDDNITIIPSKNLHIRITQGGFHFNLNTKLNELYNDASFIFEVEEKKTYNIAGVTFNGVTLGIDDKFRSILRYIIDLYESLDMIGFETNINIADIPEQQERELNLLVNIRRGKFNSQMETSMARYLWHYNGYIVPLILQKDNDKTNIINALYTDKWGVYLPSVDNYEIKYRIPLFIYHEAETLSNLYEYNYVKMRQQVDQSDINSETSGELLEGLLTLINSFDQCGKTKMLDLAEYILDKIRDYLGNESIYIINKLQIKKRKTTLDKDDKQKLKSVACNENDVEFAKNVLLENTIEADKNINKMNEDNRKWIEKYPIYNLYMNLKRKQE